MKVYVDELPKRCLECGFCCENDFGYWCQGREDVEAVFIAYEMCIKERLISCPIQSLSDYTKQVRKEVCDRIQSKIEEKARYSTNNNNGWDILIDENLFLEILDQIQGEEDG